MATISYVPRGTDGFRCTLETKQGSVLEVGMQEGEPTPATGDDLLLENEALVASLSGFAVSELGFRRSRSEDKKKSLREQADRFQRDAKAIGEYVTLPGSDWTPGWCSSCFRETRHRKVLKTGQPVAVHLCRSCGTPTTPCAAPRCPHFARRGTRSWTTPRYCAEHRHEIPSFATADRRLADFTEARERMEFTRTNFSKATKTAALALGVGAVIGPMSSVAAPAIGGAIGTMGGLSGAAASSHGLALLGGGSLAAGGLGMAGGTAVVTAAGTALGGALGATTVSAYTKEDKSFELEKLKEGDGPPVVIASGFLTEGDRGWGPWRRLVEGAYPDSPVYRVSWGAKELRAFASMVGLIGGKQLGNVALKNLALGAMKTAGKKLGPLGIALTAKDVATNPWTVARTRADMTGAVMADLLARTDGQPFVLVGHSLGARVMAEAALALGTKQGAPVLRDVHLLGAAIGNGKDWRYASEAVQGTVYNYFSRNDKVLSVLYQVAELGSKPIGLGGIPTKAKNLKNRDVSRVVNGHGDYFDHVTLSTK